MESASPTANLRGPTIVTERLLMRRWRSDDLEPFASICADKDVMRYFPATLSAEESAALIERIESHFETNSFGLWALERKSDNRLLGFTGLSTIRFACPVEGETEVGWRLGREFWGQGYASEAAAAALNFGFRIRKVERIVSMTATVNVRSQKVMERLGMHRASELDFDHPRVGDRDDLRRHVVYSIARAGPENGRVGGAGVVAIGRPSASHRRLQQQR